MGHFEGTVTRVSVNDHGLMSVTIEENLNLVEGGTRHAHVDVPVQQSKSYTIGRRVRVIVVPIRPGGRR